MRYSSLADNVGTTTKKTKTQKHVLCFALTVRSFVRWLFGSKGAFMPTLSRQRKEIGARSYVGRVWCFTMPSGFVLFCVSLFVGLCIDHDFTIRLLRCNVKTRTFHCTPTARRRATPQVHRDAERAARERRRRRACVARDCHRQLRRAQRRRGDQRLFRIFRIFFFFFGSC